MMKRTIHRHLSGWAERNDPNVLVLQGARRTGKTKCIEEFGKEFGQFIRVDLTDSKERRIFEKGVGPDELIRALFFLKDKRRDAGRTLVFLDDLQECPAAANWLSLQAGNTENIKVIASTSRDALSFLPDDKRKKETWEVVSLLPYSFEEFLEAMEEMSARQALDEVPFPDYEHDRLLHLFHLYALIGGMPEVVENYAANRELADLPPLYEKTVKEFSAEVGKATDTKKTETLVNDVLQNAFPYAAMRIKFRHFGSSSLGSREAASAFRILQKTLFLNLIYPTESINLPLVPAIDRSPRLQLLDTGLVNYSSGIQKQLFEANDLLEIFGGQIARHVAGQEILAANNFAVAFHFWIRDKLQSHAEVDFALPYGDLIIPVALKTGEPGRLRSLHQFVDAARHPFAVRLWPGRLSVQQAKTVRGKKFFLLNLPYFLAGKIGSHMGGFMKLVGN